MMPEENKQPTENTDDSREALYRAFDNPTVPEKAPRRSGNRRLRTLLIALVAVAVLVGALVLITLLPQNTPASSGSTQSTDMPTYTLLDKGDKKNDEAVVVQEITVEGKKDTYTLVYDNKAKVYRLKGYEDLDLDTYTIESLTDCATTFTASAKLDTVHALADYGLTKPTASVQLTYTDNSQATIHIGNMTPDESGYYVTLDGKEVYICSDSMVSIFLTNGAAYVDTTIITAPTADEDDQDGKAVLKELDLTGADVEQPLNIRQTLTSDRTEYINFAYVITKPYFRGVADMVANTLSTFTSLEASEAVVLHPTNKELSRYGFDNPSVVAKVTVAIATSDKSENEDETPPTRYYNMSTVTIKVGSVDKAGNYYIMANDVNAIFLVANSQLSDLVERTYENSVSSLLFIKDITTISKVSLTYGGQDYTYTLTHDEKEEDSDKKLTISRGSKTYSTQDFRTLYQLAMGIYRYGIADKTPTGQPALSIRVYTGKTPYLEVDFFATSGSLYTARTSEGELFTVKASDITNFINQAKNYENGDPVQEP